jgi:hypothetical protein
MLEEHFIYVSEKLLFSVLICGKQDKNKKMAGH